MVRLFLVVCLFCSIKLAQGQEFKSGLLKPTEGMADNTPRIIPKAGGVIKLPLRMDLSEQMPIPGDQGIANQSCTGWAACYGLLTYLKAREKKWVIMSSSTTVNVRHVFCPTYLYNRITGSNSCGTGVFLEDMLLAMQQHGGVPLAECPITCGFNNNGGNLPALAERYRILSYTRLHSTKLIVLPSDVKAQIAMEKPVLIGIDVDVEVLKHDKYGSGTVGGRFIWNHDPQMTPTYHAMLVVGYDEVLGAFKVLNSYGPNRKNRGYLWISYNTFSQRAQEAFVVENRAENLQFAEKAGGLIDDPKSSWPNAMLTATYNWIKAGYYRDFRGFRVACVNLNNRKGFAVIKVSEVMKDGSSEEVYTFRISLGDKLLGLEYKNNIITFEMDKVAKAGKNPFKKAIYYKFSVKEKHSLTK
jgi:hypothetical protein